MQFSLPKVDQKCTENRYFGKNNVYLRFLKWPQFYIFIKRSLIFMCIVGYRSRKPTKYSNIGSVASVKAALPLRELKIIVFEFVNVFLFHLNFIKQTFAG